MQRLFGVTDIMLNCFENGAMLCENSCKVFEIITYVYFIIP